MKRLGALRERIDKFNGINFIHLQIYLRQLVLKQTNFYNGFSGMMTITIYKKSKKNLVISLIIVSKWQTNSILMW